MRWGRVRLEFGTLPSCLPEPAWARSAWGPRKAVPQALWGKEGQRGRDGFALRRCHAAPVRNARLRASALSRSGWAHGRTAFAATQAKPSPTAWALGFCFRSAPSSPMRLPSRFGVTLRLLATRGLRCGSDKTSPRCAAGFLPSLRSVRAAHDGSALRFCDHAYITIRPPGLSREGGKFFAMG